MAKPRVHELAKELDPSGKKVTSKIILAWLKDQGEFVKAASSAVEPPVARRVREHFAPMVEGDGAKKAKSDAPKPGAKKAAKPAAPKPAAKPAPKVEGAKPAAPKPGPKAPKAPVAEEPKPAAKPAPKPAKPAAKPAPAEAAKPAAPKPAAPAPRGGARPGNNPFASSQGMPRPGGARPQPGQGGPRPAAPRPGGNGAPRPGGPRPQGGGRSGAPRPGAPRSGGPRPGGNGAPRSGGPRPGGNGGPRPAANGGPRPTPATARPSGAPRPNPGMMPGQSSVGRPGAPARGGARPGGARGGNGGGGRGNGGGGARPGGGFGGPRGGRGGNGSTQGAFGRGGGNAPRRRKSKRAKRQEFEQQSAPIIGGVAIPRGNGAAIRVRQGATLTDLAEKINVNPAALVTALFSLGEMVTATQSVDEDTFKLLGEELGYDVQVVSPEDEDRELLESFDIDLEAEEAEDDESELVVRPPVVTVMGHVDHGKTRLLDTIRKTNVGSGEAGGITQGIGAYQVKVNVDDAERQITFLDTPGHEAFTAMRARGAKSTDIAVLVVAADDGVMPQTVEAINHAKAADVPIVVAVNKIDKPGASPEKIRGQLTEYGLVPEEYGGDTMFVDISAKQNINVDGLLEAVLLTADASLDLRANPDMDAQGVAIEAHLDRGRGPVATVIVQRGTLRVGDSIVAGDTYGRVRRMVDEYSNDVEEAGPSRPVQVQGLNGVPGAGDNLLVVEDDRVARQIANQRNARKRNALAARTRKRVSLEDLDAVLKEQSTLNLILKGDNAGSVEALEEALLKIDVDDEVQLNIIDRGVGAVTQTNVTLAAASDAVIIAFNVRAEGKATEEANSEGVDVRYYTVIYRAIEEVEAALRGMLKPVYEEREVGKAEIRAIFKASAVGLIAGCKVEEGKARRGASVRLVRDGNVIAADATITSLRREKDDVTEVSAGYECGMVLSYPDIQVGDIIEVFEQVEVPRT